MLLKLKEKPCQTCGYRVCAHGEDGRSALWGDLRSIDAWLAESCVMAPGAVTRNVELYLDYSGCTAQVPVHPLMSRKRFSTLLKARGFRLGRDRRGAVVLWLSLR